MAPPFLGQNSPSVAKANTGQHVRQGAAVAIAVSVVVVACGGQTDPKGCEDFVNALCEKVFRCNPDADSTTVALFGHNVVECENFLRPQCTQADSGVLCPALRTNSSAASACAQVVRQSACDQNPSCNIGDAALTCGR
jgi:hypothetical protein